MRVLQVCKKFPYPAKDGESIAISSLTAGLSQANCTVDVLAINTKKHYFNIEDLPGTQQKIATYIPFDLNTNPTVWGALTNLFQKESYHVSRFIDDGFDALLQSQLEKVKYDIIQLEGLYLTAYLPTIRANSKAKVVLRAHNIEHEIWARVTKSLIPGPKRSYMYLQQKRLKQFEVEALNQVDGIVPITERDLKRFKHLGSNVPMHSCPTGIDLNQYQEAAPPHNLKVGFIGGMDWVPNQNGIKWLLKKVWPLVLKHQPEATLHIAGRNFPKWLQQTKVKQVEIHGEVEDAHDFIQSVQVFVVPILSGSGMRIKIIEAMALGAATVSTSIGAEGIHCMDGKHIRIEDDPKKFAFTIHKLLETPEACTQIGKNARMLVESSYNNRNIVSSLIEFYQSL